MSSSIIKILPQPLADKIAAGEVVQRPASAVKELLENALDAGASSVTIIIKNAGKSLIQVIDDGKGMNSADAALAFARHATSKIFTYEDLENIRTLGFRGEALASIAAVAQVELRTRERSSDIGTKVRIEGGIVQETAEDAIASGTSIVAKNLFFNTPGRRNFLKTNQTEFSHIFSVIQRVALSHPSLAMKFISDDETILDLSSSDLNGRLEGVFGERLAQSVFFFQDKNDFIALHGFLGKPDFLRKSRTEQYLFLNNRSIVNRSINHAVFSAYEHLLEKGSFPFFVLFLELDPRHVDVNVHPSKLEVKFENESVVYRHVLTAVRNALAQHDLIPTMHVDETITASEQISFSSTYHPASSSQRSVHWQDLIRPVDERMNTGEFRHAGKENIGSDILQKNQQSEGHLPSVESPGKTTLGLSHNIPLWQIHNKYIIAPIAEGVMVIDQHAAHERVLYEQTVARFQQRDGKSQQLLFPHTLEMTSGDISLTLQLQPLLEDMGFHFKLFGKTTLILEGVPIDVTPGKEKTILRDIIDCYKEDENDVTLQPREKLAQTYSCKAAIKSGDALSHPEMQGLLDQLFATTIPYVCPHGRPVIVKLSLAELDRRFGRTS